MKSLYYEAHITIEPVFDERLENFKRICNKYNFRVAELLMQKRKGDTPERSKNDSFCTRNSNDLFQLVNSTLNLIDDLKNNHFIIWRYKIEDTLLDSRIDDSFKKL